MQLWKKWVNCVNQLKPSCSNYKTFLWMMTILVAFSIRKDLAGVTSFIRSLGLDGYCYHLILHFFHSKAILLHELIQSWIKLCFTIFASSIQMINGRPIIIVDGLKTPKEGRKMPAVKSLHQESESNSKPEYIMGQYFESISLLIGIANQFFAVPLVSKIHGGVIFSKEDENKTLLDMLISLVLSTIKQSFYMVADTYYAAKKIMVALIKAGKHLITRMRTNAIAWAYPNEDKGKKRRGRHKTYGNKIILRKYFNKLHLFTTAKSPVYGEKKINIRYLVLDVLLRPFAIEVRIVLVLHAKRGKIILLSTDRCLTGLEIIKIYGLRFKIEVAFKQAIRTLGVYAYHFWMKLMDKIKKGSGDQLVYKKDKIYQEQVKRKLEAYMIYVQLGLIAQGLLIYLSVYFKTLVWQHFGSWFRTMKTQNCPSELVVSYALRSTFWTFLLNLPADHIWKKFISERIDFSQLPGLKLTG
ncbi:IS4 family transposase ISCku4 [subsurface metagenome]